MANLSEKFVEQELYIIDAEKIISGEEPATKIVDTIVKENLYIRQAMKSNYKQILVGYLNNGCKQFHINHLEHFVKDMIDFGVLTAIINIPGEQAVYVDAFNEKIVTGNMSDYNSYMDKFADMFKEKVCEEAGITSEEYDQLSDAVSEIAGDLTIDEALEKIAKEETKTTKEKEGNSNMSNSLNSNSKRLAEVYAAGNEKVFTSICKNFELDVDEARSFADSTVFDFDAAHYMLESKSFDYIDYMATAIEKAYNAATYECDHEADNVLHALLEKCELDYTEFQDASADIGWNHESLKRVIENKEITQTLIMIDRKENKSMNKEAKKLYRAEKKAEKAAAKAEKKAAKAERKAELKAMSKEERKAAKTLFKTEKKAEKLQEKINRKEDRAARKIAKKAERRVKLSSIKADIKLAFYRRLKKVANFINKIYDATAGRFDAFVTVKYESAVC